MKLCFLHCFILSRDHQIISTTKCMMHMDYYPNTPHIGACALTRLRRRGFCSFSITKLPMSHQLKKYDFDHQKS